MSKKISKLTRVKKGDEVICVPPTIHNGNDLLKNKTEQKYWGKKGTVVSVGGGCSRDEKCKSCIGTGRMKIRLEDGSLTGKDCFGYDGKGSDGDYYAWKLLSTKKERIKKEYNKVMTNLFMKEFEEELYNASTK